MIQIRGLAKSFGNLRIVENVSFVARDGEITGLIGPNGAGKTTLFRLICTVLRPDSGMILIDGIDSQHDPLGARRRLGVLPDVRGLYPRLTAREHLRYFGELHGIRRRDLEQRIAELVTLLRMEDFIDRRARGFSRGQQMKVALGRALVHRPHNVMLDEPTNGLDVATSRSVRDLLRACATRALHSADQSYHAGGECSGRPDRCAVGRKRCPGGQARRAAARYRP